jgi:glucose/arabinose dehydrogenase
MPSSSISQLTEKNDFETSGLGRGPKIEVFKDRLYITGIKSSRLYIRYTSLQEKSQKFKIVEVDSGSNYKDRLIAILDFQVAEFENNRYFFVSTLMNQESNGVCDYVYLHIFLFESDQKLTQKIGQTLSDCVMTSNPLLSGGGLTLQTDKRSILIGVGDFGQSHDVISKSTSLTKIFQISITRNWKLKKKVFSRGHRNPLDLVTTKGGRAWMVETGPKGGDELNSLVLGRHYGWPIVSLGQTYGSASDYLVPRKVGDHSGFQSPKYAWKEGHTPSSISMSSATPSCLYVGFLTSMSIEFLCNKNGEVNVQWRILIGERVRDVAEISGKALIVSTDEGKVLKVVVE